MFPLKYTAQDRLLDYLFGHFFCCSKTFERIQCTGTCDGSSSSAWLLGKTTRNEGKQTSIPHCPWISEVVRFVRQLSYAVVISTEVARITFGTLCSPQHFHFTNCCKRGTSLLLFLTLFIVALLAISCKFVCFVEYSKLQYSLLCVKSVVSFLLL